MAFNNNRNWFVEHLSLIAKVVGTDGNSDRINEFNMGSLITFLYDDTSLAENPEAAVGYSLVDQQEVKLTQGFVKSLEKVFDKHGDDLESHEYITRPEWASVVSQAKLLLKKLGSLS